MLAKAAPDQMKLTINCGQCHSDRVLTVKIWLVTYGRKKKSIQIQTKHHFLEALVCFDLVFVQFP